MLLVNTAQLILGTVLGCRFLGVGLKTVAPAFGAGSAKQVLMGVGTDQALLALATGGLPEMGLIARAIDADVAFVAQHHVVRILFVIILAPLAFRLRIKKN